MRPMTLGVVLLALLAGPGAVYGADAALVAREHQLKAAYVFNFLKFVDWPAAASQGDLLVCVRGAPAVDLAMRLTLENRKVGTRVVAVRTVSAGEQVNDCSVLYIGDHAGRGSSPFSAADAKLPLLTISDADGFSDRGGTIELFTANNRLRFNINVDNARAAGVRISAGLLQLAASVKGRP